MKERHAFDLLSQTIAEDLAPLLDAGRRGEPCELEDAIRETVQATWSILVAAALVRMTPNELLDLTHYVHWSVINGVPKDEAIAKFMQSRKEQP